MNSLPDFSIHAIPTVSMTEQQFRNYPLRERDTSKGTQQLYVCQVRSYPIAAAVLKNDERSRKTLAIVARTNGVHFEIVLIGPYHCIIRYGHPTEHKGRHTTPQQYADDLYLKSCKVFDEYGEGTLNDVVIGSVDLSICHCHQQYWADRLHADSTTILFQMKTLFSIPKSAAVKWTANQNTYD